MALRTSEDRSLSVYLLLPEEFDRASAIRFFETARDRILATARQQNAALGNVPAADLMNHVLRVGASVRFREAPGGIVADTGASASDFADLAVVVVPAFIRYVREAKAMEARMMLSELVQTVSLHYIQFDVLPGSAGPVPAVPMQDPQVADFSVDPTFSELQVQGDQLRYSYSIISTDDPNTVILRAEGDLDGDGERSRFEITVTCADQCTASEIREESPYE